jgi:two-component system, OmpR family, alkaline phosphatase synthesis response regulator PhoP
VTDRGEEAIELVHENSPALMVLDLMLPGLDGLEVCRRLKKDEKTAALPIVILTAKGEEQDVIAGFQAGADDYINKPFSPKVLTARVAAVLRRTADSRPDAEGAITYGEMHIHPGRFAVRINDEPVNLTHTEFRILQFLASRPGWVFSRNQIVRGVHGDDYPVTGRSVDVQVASLRKKLGAAAQYITTVRGVGYKLGE